MKTNIPWMLTAYGGKFYPSLPFDNKYDINDIAHALSNVCRWGGHCRVHYSVAQHSCMVYDLVRCMTKDRNVRMFALLHDASEAYISDITRPVKIGLPDYRSLEGKVMLAILDSFGLRHMTYEKSTDVIAADNMVLVTEKRDLLPRINEVWEVERQYRPAPQPIQPWTQRRAKKEFLNRFWTVYTYATPKTYPETV